MKLNLPSPYTTLGEYVQDILKRLGNQDPTLRKLQIDDFHYPDVDLEGGEYFDNPTISKLLNKAKESPHIQELEFRFVEFDPIVTRALISLLNTPREWKSVSIIGCSGLGGSSQLFMQLVMSLDQVDKLILSHNDIHYHGFCSLGMCLPSNKKLTTLHLKRDCLSGDNARALFENLHSNTCLTELVLNFCRFDDEGVDALSQFLEQNTHIKLLDMGACYLPDEHIERIILALVGHPAIETLTLTLNSCHKRGIIAMAKLLQGDKCRLRRLDLSHQKDEHQKVSVEPLAESLKTNETLRYLQLSRNRLSSKDIKLLFETLQVNSTLCVLDLNNNCIGDDGAQQIAAVLPKLNGLRNLSVLNNDIRAEASTLALSRSMQFNHQLQVLDIKATLPHVDQIQYYSALNSGGRHLISTTKHVPLGLWPLVLERAQRKRYRDDGEENEIKFAPDVSFYLLSESPALLESR